MPAATPAAEGRRRQRNNNYMMMALVVVAVGMISILRPSASVEREKLKGAGAGAGRAAMGTRHHIPPPTHETASQPRSGIDGEPVSSRLTSLELSAQTQSSATTKKAVAADPTQPVVAATVVAAGAAAGPAPPTPPWPANPLVDLHVTDALKAYWAALKKRRAAHSAEIQAEYGSWAPNHAPYHQVSNCWNMSMPPGTDFGRHERGFVKAPFAPMTYTLIERCSGNHFHWNDNGTNWDVSRRAFCAEVNKELEAAHPFPAALKPVLELNYGQRLTARGDLPTKFAPAFASGGHAGELPFEPAAVKYNFLQLRAALTLYYQGSEPLTSRIEPRPGSSDYTTLVAALAQRFAAAFVHGGDLTAGVIGDSTTAGQDNCVFDAWPYALERQLVPLFGAGKVDFKMRDAGHNGGFETQPQLVCAKGILGDDVDMIVLSAPFVKPAGHEFAVVDFVRRSLIDGAIPFVAFPFDRSLLARYTAHGVARGGASLAKQAIEEWWPRVDDCCQFWGRTGDGLCHFDKTRAGSAAVTSRNWHPGPMGHQIFADTMAYFWADAAIKALDDITHALKGSGGRLDKLRERFPRRSAVPAADLPGTEDVCKRAAKSNDIPAMKAKANLCDAKGGMAGRGSPACVSALQPAWGPRWASLTEGFTSPIWAGSGSDTGASWAVKREGTDGRDWWKEHHQGEVHSYTTCGGNCYGAQSRPTVFETNRSEEACKGFDYHDGYAVSGGSGGWATFKFPARSLSVGHISLCGRCNGSAGPTVELRGGDSPTSQTLPVDWGVDAWGNGVADKDDKVKCATVSTELPESMRSADLFLGVHCTDNEGFLRFLATS